ncbi:MAG TPA: hypothetical protein ENN32_04540 [Chloroflexi bacterium]|nr:hypothetical protein [Chloroflexota bacterium]
MKRQVSLLLALVLTLVMVIPVMAQDPGPNGYIYGVVFVDNNKDGQWVAEPGVANVEILFSGGSGVAARLRTAWTDNLINEASGSIGLTPPDMQCSHLNEAHINAPQGCTGTFGLRPVQEWSWWHIWVNPATLPTSCRVVHPEGKSGTDFDGAFIYRALPADTPGWLEIPLVCGTGLDPVSGAEAPVNPTLSGQHVYLSMFRTLVGDFVARLFVH